MTTRFLSTLRDALFETTSEASHEVSATDQPSALGDVCANAAAAALRQSLDEQLGPGVREFSLQCAALQDALPSPVQRKRAALRVLALKGISAPALVLELERALAALAAQSEAFASKLASRQATLLAQQNDAVEACRAEIAAAEQAVVSLQQQLEAERCKISEACERRERTLAACSESAAELAAKQSGFGRAFAAIHQEYTALKQELATPEAVHVQ